MNFTDKKIEEYASLHSSPEPEVLAELSRETHIRTYMPRMLSGHLQGRLLSLISHLVNPELILEIGTFTGYSAICLAEGLRGNGRLITIDINEELKPRAEYYFNRSVNGDRITMLCGDAMKIIPGLDIFPDLVFLDADKENYPAYWKILFPILKKGGVLVADNILWSGKVTDEKENDPETKALRDFTHIVLQEKNAEEVILPVRDGLMIVRKK